MARYMTLAPIFIQQTGVASSSTVQPGTEIDYDGPANPTLFPLDAEARAAHTRVLAKRNPQQRVRHDIAMRRALRGLPKSLRRRCEQAAADAVNDPEHIDAPPARKRHGVSIGPMTYPGAWKSQGGKPVASALLKPR